MADGPAVTRIGPDAFLVVEGDTRAIVYVAGPPGDRWAFWNGRVFRSSSNTGQVAHRKPGALSGGSHALTAPMPATVISVLVEPGSVVAQGAPLVVLEAMKMELPVRALESGTVTKVCCREGELVQADQVLVEMS